MKQAVPFVILLALAACGGKTPPPAPTALAPQDAAPAVTAPPAAEVAAATQQASQTLQANATTWSPEALEDLLAPVALYPDPVLMQLLVTVTNPQEVLDAGNWLIANPNLSGKTQDQAAEKAGFTLPMRALMQFPDVVDKLCLNMPWTEELGQAYVNDQQGVMDAVQRLRVQAQNVGNLKSSPQLKVETKKEAGKPDVVTVSPPDPKVVYVPQYDPQAVYAAAAASPGTTVTTTTTTSATGTTSTTTATNAAPATTNSSSSSTKSEGHSTESLIATGLLAFGAGMLVNEIFDDDDNWYHSSYYGPMWHGPMPYYPPYPYRPVYGPGFYPGNAYVRPPTYIRGGNTIVINQNNNYYNRYNNSRNVVQTRNSPRSPITAARPNRPELQQLNARAAQGAERRAPVSSEAWKGKGAYAGSDPKVRQSLDRQAASSQRLQTSRPATRGTPTVAGKAAAPKIQGSYAGARPAADRTVAQNRPAAQRDVQRPSTANRDVQRPATRETASPAQPLQDRGYGGDNPRASTGLSAPQSQGLRGGGNAASSGAFARAGDSGSSARMASQRGHQSLSGGASRARPGRR